MWGVNTIYVYSPANGTCPAVENSFTVTIDAVVQADAPGDEVACGSYTLPALTDGNYFDGPNGGGNALSAGDQITNVGVNTIYVYSPANGTCPAVENSFTVTIDAVVQADAPGDEVACGSYTLPALTDGNYFDGPNGGGNALSAGDQITNVGVNTIYVYSPANGTCPAVENSFTVTIDAVVQADAPGDEVACGSYTLPALTDGNYFDGPNGGGNALSAGDQITNVGVNTIYVYSPANGTCPAVENSFTVTIDAVVQADAPGDEVACGSYTLPALTDGKYFDGPNGGGNALSAGDQITNVGVNTIYVYSPANGTCPAVENSFTVTIDAVVQADAPGDEVACGSYTLPALTDGNYFDGPNGGGNALSAGDQITNVGVNTIYVYSPANGTCPAVENSFTVTIDAVVQADAPGDEVACGSYTLPALTDGNYFDGPNGGGNALSAGDQITNVGVNTIYVYSPANGTCPAVENSFTVTIDAVVQADAPGDEVACGSYTLPALTDGNYFDGPNGGGNALSAGDQITNVGVNTIYVYSPANGTCPAVENSFTVTIDAVVQADAPGDEVACGSYTLPALTDGNYFDGPNGGGNALSAGDQITNVGVNTIYVYSPANGTCPAVENSFTVTIDAVVQADAPGDEVACGSYTLPALTDGNYFDGPNGGGNALSAGDQITNVGVNTIYVYSPANGTCPAVENSFTVTIDAVVQADAPGDEVACGSYTLPALTDGNYFDGPNGGGNALSAGDQITNVGVNTIYVYSPANGTCPAVENSFTVTIDAVVQADAPGDEVACGSYTLPALTDGNYFDGPNGGGNALSAGDQITNVGGEHDLCLQSCQRHLPCG